MNTHEYSSLYESEQDTFKSLALAVAHYCAGFTTMYKKVSRHDITEEEFEKFIETLYGLSSIDPFACSVEVAGNIYPLESYQIDARIGEALVLPRFNGIVNNHYIAVDLAAENNCEVMLNPAEFIAFQYRWLNCFKAAPGLSQLPVRFGHQVFNPNQDMFAGNKVYLNQSLSETKSLPYSVAMLESFIKGSELRDTMDDVIYNVCLNLVSNLGSYKK